MDVKNNKSKINSKVLAGAGVVMLSGLVPALDTTPAIAANPTTINVASEVLGALAINSKVDVNMGSVLLTGANISGAWSLSPAGVIGGAGAITAAHVGGEVVGNIVLDRNPGDMQIAVAAATGADAGLVLDNLQFDNAGFATLTIIPGNTSATTTITGTVNANLTINIGALTTLTALVAGSYTTGVAVTVIDV